MKNSKGSRFHERQENSIRKKLVIVGDDGSGKSSLVTVLCKNEFPEVYIPKIFGSHITTIEVDDKLVELYFVDTNAREDDDRLRPLAYSCTDVVLICFSISNPVSLSNVSEKWFPEVKHHCPNVPILLIGTKKDLRHDGLITDEILQETDKQMTTVKSETGSQMAQEIKAFAFLECSAKTNEGIDDVLLTAARASLANIGHHARGSRRKCRVL